MPIASYSRIAQSEARMSRFALPALATLALLLSGCAGPRINWWSPDLLHGLLSHWNTDAPDNDPFGKLNKIQQRAEGITSNDRFHRWE